MIDIKQDLLKMQDEKYKNFHSGLCPGVNNIIGIRIPVLRDYAKKIKGQVDISSISNDYYEEVMLKGMLIGLEKKLDFEKISNFIPLINNWAVCDTFCAGLKQIKNNKEKMWLFLQNYINSKKEFEVRFAVVTILDFYIDEQYIDRVLELLKTVKHEGYYAKMAVAWAYSFCFIKFFEKTKNEFESFDKNNIDKFIYNKSIQKSIESYRLTREQKNILKSMKI
mgnify:FL=1